MRKLVFISCVTALLTACDVNKDVHDAPKSVELNEQGLWWELVPEESTNCLKLKKIKEVAPASLTPAYLVALCNQRWEKVQVEFLRQSNDTVYLQISHSAVLTQQMGSTGAAEYLASTTYHFTELAGINHVNFDFEEGDHARPGTYQRSDFDCI